MDSATLEAFAYDEATRLYEKEFSFNNPYTVVIETNDIPFNDIDDFCRLVEKELLAKGEKIHRNGQYFKIDRYQKKKA